MGSLNINRWGGRWNNIPPKMSMSWSPSPVNLTDMVNGTWKMWFSEGSWNGKIVLNYWGVSDIITMFLISERRRQVTQDNSMYSTPPLLPWRWGRDHESRNVDSFQELQKIWDGLSSRTSGGRWGSATLMPGVELCELSDFQKYQIIKLYCWSHCLF